MDQVAEHLLDAGVQADDYFVRFLTQRPCLRASILTAVLVPAWAPLL